VWQKLLELLFEKFVRPLTSAERGERRAKQNIVFIHEALLECHQGYLAYSQAPNDANFLLWRSAVLQLVQRIEAGKTVLATFGQEAFNSTLGYVYPESAAPEISPRERMLLEFEAAITYLTTGLSLLDTSAKPTWNDDFIHASTKLREFIAERLSLGEVQQAQELFRRQR
jgi:hypothetical protein